MSPAQSTLCGDIFYHIQCSTRPGDFVGYMKRGIQTTLSHLQTQGDDRLRSMLWGGGSVESVLIMSSIFGLW